MANTRGWEQKELPWRDRDHGTMREPEERRYFTPPLETRRNTYRFRLPDGRIVTVISALSEADVERELTRRWNRGLL
ncbi:MAG: hypothetical protein WC878_03825 [Candidatus Paceibacterota bacterium]